MSTMLEGDADGATYEHDEDYLRLNGQRKAVFDVMADGRWHTLAELAGITGGTEAAVSARLRDLRKARFGSWQVTRDRYAGGWWRYRLEGKMPLGAAVAAPNWRARAIEAETKLAELAKIAASQERSMDLWWSSSRDDWPVPDDLPGKFLRVALTSAGE